MNEYIFDHHLFTYEEAQALNIKCVTPPEDHTCNFCRSKIIYKGFVVDGQINQFFPITCHCVEAKQFAHDNAEKELETILKQEREKEQRRQLNVIKEQSGISRRFSLRTFDNYDCKTNKQTKVMQTAKKYAAAYDRLKDQEQNGLFLYGGCGCGKTHLACAVANYLLSQRVRCKFTTFEDILLEIKNTYNNEEESELTIRERYKNIDFLVLDDLGKEKSTEFTVQVLFDLIKARYESNLPTVITSNYNRQELEKRLTVKEDDLTAGAIVSRIYEMCFAVSMENMNDWRKQ